MADFLAFHWADQVVGGVADRARVDDARLGQLPDELHRLDVGVGDTVGLAVGVEQPAAVVDHHHDHGLGAEVVARAGPGAEAEDADLLQRLPGGHQLIPGRWAPSRRPRPAATCCTTTPARRSATARRRSPCRSSSCRAGPAGSRRAAVLLQALDQVVGVGDAALLGELERLEPGPGADRRTGLGRDARRRTSGRSCSTGWSGRSPCRIPAAGV